jgi:hypothetical protein
MITLSMGAKWVPEDEPQASKDSERSELSLRASEVSMVPEGAIPEPEDIEIDEADEPEKVGRVLLQEHEQLNILAMFEESMARGFSLEATYKGIAKTLGRHPQTIAKFVRRMRSTVSLAKLTLAANANRMVKKVIEKAPTSELIDVLSRPNMGVLEPRKSEGSGGGGFFINVKAENLGAVQIGIVNKENSINELRPNAATGIPLIEAGPTDQHPTDPGRQGSDVTPVGRQQESDARPPRPESPGESHAGRAGGSNGQHGQAVQVARPRKRSSREFRVQRADEKPAGPVVKRRHQKGGGRVVDRSIHLDAAHEGVEEHPPGWILSTVGIIDSKEKHQKKKGYFDI